MTFGATADIFFAYNFYEAVFWLLLGSVCLSALRFVGPRYHRWLTFSGVNIFLFGVTDGIELYTGGFLHAAQWLLVWKVLHVLGLIVSIVWYLRLRRES